MIAVIIDSVHGQIEIVPVISFLTTHLSAGVHDRSAIDALVGYFIEELVEFLLSLVAFGKEHAEETH